MILSTLRLSSRPPAVSSVFLVGSSPVTVVVLSDVPVNGSWSVWSDWSSLCSGECLQTRERVCDSPPPQYSGLPCVGQERENTTCYGEDCCPGYHTQPPQPCVGINNFLQTLQTTSGALRSLLSGDTNISQTSPPATVLDTACRKDSLWLESIRIVTL